jgi:hypothetical protein
VNAALGRHIPRDSTTATLSGVCPTNLRTTPAVIAALMIPFVTVACCSFAEPSLRPGDSRDVLAALARHGVVVADVMAGESACDDPGLIANALHVRVTGPEDPAPSDVFIYLFRVRGWDDSAATVDACEEAYAASIGDDANVARVDVPTYRAFGANWSDGLTQAIRAALEEASTQGT